MSRLMKSNGKRIMMMKMKIKKITIPKITITKMSSLMKSNVKGKMMMRMVMTVSMNNNQSKFKKKDEPFSRPPSPYARNRSGTGP